LNGFLDNRFSFDPVTIRVEAQMKFSQEAVGKDLLKIYRKALEKKKN
jgi:hypothetical protein